MMTSLVLMPWATTDWQAGGRFASTTPLPLNDEGRARAAAWGDAVAGREISALYSSQEKASVETASIVVARSEAKHRQVAGLHEVAFGLWEGMTKSEVSGRFPKLYKKWTEDPAAVSIPDGEDCAEAAARIRSALKQIARKHRGGAVGAVLGPTALALARCELENVPIGRFRDFFAHEPVWYELDPSGKEGGRHAGAAMNASGRSTP
jgi:probable phosphoglycerate mutase